jgi:hypothetical protein
MAAVWFYHCRSRIASRRCGAIVRYAKALEP